MIRVNNTRPIDVINEAITDAIKTAQEIQITTTNYSIWNNAPEFTLPDELGEPQYWKQRGFRAVLIAPNSMTGKILFHLEKKVLIQTYDDSFLIKPRKGYEKEFNWYVIRGH